MTDDDGSHQPPERLWTPWRMQYVGGDRRDAGCVFCRHQASGDDRASLILHRSEHAFVILNLFPYNTGHVMIVPNAHEPSPETIDDATAIDMTRLIPKTLRVLRTALNPTGFNLGINLGDDAGAGIAAHLHQHIVPRWRGDANFMPILAGTKVLPELLPATYAKLRAEFARDHAERIDLLVTSRADRNRVLLDGDSLPSVSITGEAIWKTATRSLHDRGIQASLTGWATPINTANPATPMLLFESPATLAPVQGTLTWVPLAEARPLLPTDFSAPS